jgi:proteasome lid subunit RPN8/RPN11
VHSKRDRKNDANQATPTAGLREGGSSAVDSALATEKVTLREAGDGPKPLARQFPGPRNADAALRVALERSAYAELLAHAKASLEAEVCGVLVGQVCEDEEGPFVHVEAVIRGAAATEASTHVTFTQTTWNTIHQTLERDFPKLRIVGWYHTHPGFGVEFSDMDLFIQKNFFSGAAQIALVTDPLSGAVAICINTPQGPRYLPRFWVDGREQPCRAPVRHRRSTEAAPGPDPGADTEAALARFEARLAQLVHALDEHQASYHRFLLFCAVVFCLAVIGAAGYFIYSTYNSKLEPPRLNSYVPVPIQVGDKTILVGLGVVDWKVPDEMNAIMLQLEQIKKLAAEKEAKEAAAKAGTNGAVAATNAPADSKPPVK